MPSSTALFIHVPVNTVELVNGPGQNEWSDIFEVIDYQLEEADYDWRVITGVEVELAMQTPASGLIFKRKVTIKNGYSFHGDGFYFKGIFCGQLVNGFFNKRSRDGWLNPDF